MKVGELIGYVAAALVALSTIIQISPIKINPWSWIAKKIGRAINGEVIEKVNKIETEFTVMRESFDEREARDARTKILRFGDEILHDVKHSKDHFDEILLCITDYAQYCDAHPSFKNHMTESTTKHILNTYEKCMQEHSFL